MPAPIGQEPRDRKFLLRMTEREDRYARSLAVEQRTSLNDAITGLIRDRMATEEPPAPPEPEPAPKPHKPAQRRPLQNRGRAAAALDAWAPAPHIEGQTSITDPDQ